GSALGAAALGLVGIQAGDGLEGALERLSPGLVAGEGHHDATVVASRASSAAYRMARASAVARLHELARAAELLS
ncbi:sugar kinase, partial [Intrasporangium calvum]|nr:sugar kinase [Intrasporangium calvum]